jgi:hypothetical protein
LTTPSFHGLENTDLSRIIEAILFHPFFFMREHIMNAKLMSAEQAVNLMINLHPSLYYGSNLDRVKMHVFDQIFNVIGNGIRDTEEFLNEFTINKKNKPYLDSVPQKYLSGEPLFYAYTESEIRFGDKETPVFESGIDGLFTSEELTQMPQVKITRLAREKQDFFVPYPNFQKEYSLVWRVDLNQLNDSWFEAATFYYQNAKKFFHSEHVHHYSSAFPIDKIKAENLIESYEKRFNSYRTEGMSEKEYHQAITKAYGLEYEGDTEDFVRRRWVVELARIELFIDTTLDKLATALSQKHEGRDLYTIKPKM